MSPKGYPNSFPPNRHYLSNKDFKAKTADCVICGPGVAVYLRKNRGMACKIRNNERSAEQRKNNPERNAKVKLAYQQKRRGEQGDIIESIKRLHGCQWCGARSPQALAFDHIKPNQPGDKPIGSMLGSAYKAINEQLKRTRLLCYTDHHRRHWQKRTVEDHPDLVFQFVEGAPDGFIATVRPKDGRSLNRAIREAIATAI